MNHLTMKKSILICYLFTLLMVLTIPGYAARNASKTALGIATPYESYPVLITLHADKATIIKKSPHLYQVILRGVHENMTYKENMDDDQASVNQTTKPVDRFIRNWRAIASRKKIQTNITGIVTNLHTVGHYQFYANVYLTNPMYKANTRELIVNMQPAGKEQLKEINEQLDMDNATIFINGCYLCDCQHHFARCEKL